MLYTGCLTRTCHPFAHFKTKRSHVVGPRSMLGASRGQKSEVCKFEIVCICMSDA